MPREASIVSARDGLRLTLSNFVSEDQSHISESFLIEVKAYDVRAEARASTYMAEDLGKFFQSIADDWKGWKGSKSWSTLESELELAATSDSLGHVRLEFVLRKPHNGFQWELRGALELEAGQLDRIAQDVRLAWNAP
jgi:hypothetical protein